MYVPVWVFIVLGLVWLFGSRLRLARCRRAARHLWAKLTQTGKRRALERFLRAVSWRDEASWVLQAASPDAHRPFMSGADVQAALGDTPEALEACFQQYLDRFEPEHLAWAAALVQILWETLDEQPRGVPLMERRPPAPG